VKYQDAVAEGSESGSDLEASWASDRVNMQRMGNILTFIKDHWLGRRRKGFLRWSGRPLPIRAGLVYIDFTRRDFYFEGQG
jgi:hypothetical protein